MRRSNREKKMHRKINKAIRKINEDLEKDSLWRGRFVLREVRYESRVYEDNSGVYAHIAVRMYDRFTGKFKDEWFSDFDFLRGGWKVFWFTNNFIVQDVNVWSEEIKPQEYRDKNYFPWKNMPLRALINTRGYSIIGENR